VTRVIVDPPRLGQGIQEDDASSSWLVQARGYYLTSTSGESSLLPEQLLAQACDIGIDVVLLGIIALSHAVED
jgi:hypothetical protein